jgi:hypothetical protein
VNRSISDSTTMDSKQEVLKRKRITSDEESSDSDTEQKKPLCKYGEKCYQKNSYHLQKFRHPHRDNAVVKPAEHKLEVTNFFTEETVLRNKNIFVHINVGKKGGN